MRLGFTIKNKTANEVAANYREYGFMANRSEDGVMVTDLHTSTYLHSTWTVGYIISSLKLRELTDRTLVDIHFSRVALILYLGIPVSAHIALAFSESRDRAELMQMLSMIPMLYLFAGTLMWAILSSMLKKIGKGK